MKTLLIINPRSKGGRSQKFLDHLLNLSSEKGLEFDYVYAFSYRSIIEYARQANLMLYDNIIAVGGDGTINGVLNGFFDEKGRRLSKAVMGVIYTGTSPDFCKSYGIPLDIEESVKCIIERRYEKIRVGRIEYYDQISSSAQLKYFGCCANVGIGARIATRSNNIRKYTGDFLGTLIAALWAIGEFKPGDLTMEIDDKRVVIHKAYNISVGRTQYIASGIRLNKGMSQDDPRFYLMTAKEIKISNILSLLKQVYSGSIQQTSFLRLDYGSDIHFFSNTGVDVEFDGDPAGKLPCRIDIANDPLDLICKINFHF